MNFKRHRRLRKNSLMRDLVRETSVSVNDFIQPLFVKENLEQKEEVTSMPGVFQFALTDLLEEVESCVQLGIKAFILFGIPAEKDEVGSQASSPDGIVQKSLRLIKQHYPDLILIADTCLCEFTSHGHCGILDGETVVNDLSLDRLVQVAISQAEAGAAGEGDTLRVTRAAERYALGPSVSSMRKKSSRCYSSWPPWTEGSTRNPYLQYHTNRNGKLGNNTTKH